MSAIAGIYQLGRQPIDCALLKRMIDCVAHKGSDAVRTWVEGFIGLGHRQLCTTEEARREIQPAVNSACTCCVTFDGRVDNREELIDRLEPTVGKLNNPSDVELLLYAYEVWDIDCPRSLIGDFSFALWDIRRQRLFCARDTYGIRPFYYYFNGKTFIFGSDCIQVFQDSAIPLEVDKEKIAEWFTWCGVLSHSYGNSGKTFFRDICALPPAHYLIVSDSGISLKRYWDADPHKEIRYRRRQEYAEHFLSVFREAVRCRLMGSTPIGAELSGGFDSSSIVCVASELLRSEQNGNRRLATFSLVFNQLGCDERPLIHTVVEKYQLESHQLTADGLCSPVGFPESAPLRDVNSPDQLHSLKALQALYQLAYDKGVRVMLSGEGAEQHVLGNSFVLDSLLRHCHWGELLRRLSIMLGESSYRSLLSRTVKFGLWPLVSGNRGARYYYRWLHPELYDEPGLPMLTPSFARDIAHQLAEQRERIFGFMRFKEWGKQLTYEGFAPGASVLCRSISSSVPIERRFPYHDRRLIEYCLAIPPEEKFHHLRDVQKRNIRGRALQRSALEGILPNEVSRSQAKVNFNDISRKRMLELRDTYTNMFCPPAVPEVSRIGVVQGNGFWQFISDFFVGLDRDERFNPTSYFWINRVVELEIWLKALEKIEHERLSQRAGQRAADFLRPRGETCSSFH